MQTVRNLVEHFTGIGRPSREDLKHLVHARKAHAFKFRDDGVVPNNPHWPAIFYRGALRLRHDLDPAAVIEEVFANHGWGGSWRAVIYDYLHYHSGIHEALGVTAGTAVVQLGGGGGRTLRVKPGDILILPAGTGHQCLQQDDEFLVVGAYPSSGKYDVCRRPRDYELAKSSIWRVGRPRQDPVYGRAGPLLDLWPNVEGRRRSAAG